MCKNPILNEFFRIHLLFFTTAFDIGKSNGKYPQYLTTQCYDNANDNFPHLHEFTVTYRPCPLKKKQYKDQWEKSIPVSKKEVAYFDHHFTATIPQKLYHLKNTSQYRNPSLSRSSLFSNSL